ncbi:zinc finger C-x8-C-x5-C-x3-H type family protein [Actinidia rufa]|uniref:Zinc finger C-x8-C-x5-C-x3-H type family protein n=1 Tax=Actinidia rufa TaxID=165716 RepID=A0A7J0GFQ1_9ERIC|nr:zinc finger C-x8-C-x5-C-x3-H type family protein [Actinidia rufa]
MANKVERPGGGGASAAGPSRTERRKVAKKDKRKQKRKGLAEKEREEEEARLNDPGELRRIQLEKERENERLEREQKEFEEHEGVFLEALAAKRKAEDEDEERRKALEDEFKQNPLVINAYLKLAVYMYAMMRLDMRMNIRDDDWEYIEEGPPEIIWQGNEIIVKKKKVRVKRKDADQQIKKEVCKNGSFHLRGNVYIHYKSLGSAVLAYQSTNGRYFAGKQVTCEFIGLTKWKVAICGEYMKSRLKTCSRGTACNFIHCFRNPGGDYEWADLDKPPPKYWARKMAALFGYTEESGYDNLVEQGRNYSKTMTADADSLKELLCLCPESNTTSPYGGSIRSGLWFILLHPFLVRDLANLFCSSTFSAGTTTLEDLGPGERDSSKSRYENYDARRSNRWERHTSGSRQSIDLDEKIYGGLNFKNNRRSKSRTHDSDYDGDWSKDRDGDRHQINTRESSNHQKKAYVLPDDYDNENRTHGTESGGHSSDEDKRDRTHDSASREAHGDKHHRHTRKRQRQSNEGLGSIAEHDNSVKEFEDEHYPRESYSEKLEPRNVKKRHHFSRWDNSSMELSEVNFSAEVLISDRHHETTSSIKHQTSFRDSSSDESCESENLRLHSRRSKSRDSGNYSDEDLDNRDRWESDKVGSEKHRESERILSSGDFDPGGNPNSHDQNSDERNRESRSRGSHHQKSSNGSEEVGPAEKCRESEEKKTKHRRKHRTHSHKQHHKKDSSQGMKARWLRFHIEKAKFYFGSSKILD